VQRRGATRQAPCFQPSSADRVILNKTANVTNQEAARLLYMMIRCVLPLLATAIAAAQSMPKLQLQNVKSEAVTYKGKRCIQLTDQIAYNDQGERIAVIEGSDFGDGVIELELTGDTLPTAEPTARGFTGIAFHAQANGSAYEAFYLRPKNGRAEDQEQRNHSTQYVSMPGFPWQKLRQETPGKYESYVDLLPGEWIRMKIEIHAAKARLYVNGSAQPVLIVNDLKHANSRGALAFWIGPGTVAHFADLKVTNETK
jgi:hypothetical protein